MPSGHTPRSLSARTHKDADEEVSARSRRIVVKSLAAGRQIRGGSVWSCPQPIAGPLPPPSPRRRPGTAALGNAPGDVSSELPAPVTLCVGPKQLTAPRHDVRGERPMSLFNSPARAHMFFRQSTSRDALMTGSLMAPQGSVLSSRPHASHTLPRRLPSMQSDETASFPGADPSTPRQRLFAHAGSESSEDEAGLHGVNSAHSTADVGRSLSGGGSNELWSLSGSDDESIATHRPSTASLGENFHNQY